MDDFDELAAAAFRRERVAARRLAASAAMPEALALRLTLERSAGAAGLAQLLAARASERLAALERRAARERAGAARLAVKRAAKQAAPGAWQGWFDGSAHPNPGRMGIGALLLGPHGERVEISRAAGYGNSGEAEYGALIALLEAASRLRPAALVVYGDSQVVIGDVLDTGAAGARGLEQQRARVRALLGQLAGVTLHWIPRHRNGAADRLSQQAVALQGAGED